MHALRIGHQGEELLTPGRISLPIPEPIRSRLMDVRGGGVPLAEVLAELDDVVQRVERLAASADLPGAPDREAVDRFLVSSYGSRWSEGGGVDALDALHARRARA